MQRDVFEQTLRSEGYAEIVSVTRPADGALAVHTHPFEAKALILQGQIQLQCEDGTRSYAVGDVFHLHAGQPHAESYGPQGVTYLVGRK